MWFSLGQLDAANTAPTITPIPSQVIVENSFTNIVLHVWDAETQPRMLFVSGSSTNPTLLPVTLITFGAVGDTGQCLMRIHPAPNMIGRTLVTVTVSDGVDMASTSFVLTIEPVDVSRTTNKYFRTWLTY